MRSYVIIVTVRMNIFCSLKIIFQKTYDHKKLRGKMITTGRKLWLFTILGVFLGVISSCIKDDNITPDEGSCCQDKVCKIPCPASLDKPAKGM